MNPQDYTLEQWVKLWQEAHESDSVPTQPKTYTYFEFLKEFAPNDYSLEEWTPVSPTVPSIPDYNEWWRRITADPTPMIAITDNKTIYTGDL